MGKKKRDLPQMWGGVVVSCVDGRFILNLARWMKQRSLKKGQAYDLITTLGGAAEVAELKSRPELREKLALAIEDHRVGTVFLAVHVDCLGLRRRFPWAEQGLSHDGYLELLEQATAALVAEWPDVQVKWLAVGRQRCRRLRRPQTAAS